MTWDAASVWHLAKVQLRVKFIVSLKQNYFYKQLKKVAVFFKSQTSMQQIKLQTFFDITQQIPKLIEFCCTNRITGIIIINLAEQSLFDAIKF
jgi:hypothetical protein